MFGPRKQYTEEYGGVVPELGLEGHTETKW